MRKFTYFRCEDGFVGVTDESPKGMGGMVFAGRGPLPGQGLDSVREQAYGINQLYKMEKIRADDVPDDWFAMIGYERRVKPEPIPEQNVVPITIELPGDRLRRKILAEPGAPEHSQWQKEQLQFWILLAISAAISWYLTFFVWKQ